MEPIVNKHKLHWSDKKFFISVATGLFFLTLSLFVNYWAGTYATRTASNAVTDILLDNLPVINTDFIFSNGAIIFVLFMVILVASEPKRIPFILKSTALFVLIRSVFVTMTHIGPSPEQIILRADSDDVIRYVAFGGDLFFSGHTGLPFLMALMFWGNRKLRFAFLFASVVAGVGVILGHLHYTIDVFAAFFITYGIFHIARRFFKKDYKTFIHGLGGGKII
ncbi:MAG: phosphatase PAP2-related protein [Patescibacteria group bacterium]